MITGYTTMAGLGVRASESAIGYLAATELFAALGLIPVALLLRGRAVFQQFSAHFVQSSLAGFVSLAAFGLVLISFQWLPMGPVTAVRETSVAFAVLFGVLFLGERLTAARWIALGLILIGVLLLL